MRYSNLVARSGQINTPPGSYTTVKDWIRNGLINQSSSVLEIGCSMGFISIEISRYAGARTLGADLDPESVVRARANISPFDRERCAFICAGADLLPFATGVFSHVVIGGHLPFVSENVRADHVREAVRVLCPWGFVLTAMYFYYQTPPSELIEAMNTEFNMHLSPHYGMDYWSGLYKRPELDCEYEVIYTFTTPDEQRKDDYLEQLDPAYHDKWRKRLDLFAENGRYMRYFVGVYRKFPDGGTIRQVPRGGIYTGFRKLEGGDM